jgi:hypothetical protein
VGLNRLDPETLRVMMRERMLDGVVDAATRHIVSMEDRFKRYHQLAIPHAPPEVQAQLLALLAGLQER